MCHLSSEGSFTFLVKEQAADLDQKFIYNYYYKGIVIASPVLKNLVSVIQLDQDWPNKVLLEHRFICSLMYYLILLWQWLIYQSLTVFSLYP